jgi:hypothetical protein
VEKAKNRLAITNTNAGNSIASGTDGTRKLTPAYISRLKAELLKGMPEIENSLKKLEKNAANTNGVATTETLTKSVTGTTSLRATLGAVALQKQNSLMATPSAQSGLSPLSSSKW